MSNFCIMKKYHGPNLNAVINEEYVKILQVSGTLATFLQILELKI